MVTAKQARQEAMRAFAGLNKKGRSLDLQLIVMALQGKKVSFDKVVKMIDDMVVLLGKEQEADDKKKAYCEEEFDKADDKKKALERSISDLEKVIEEAKESVTTLTGEIKDLEDGIVKLDREVVQATEMRKEEHEEFTATLAGNNAAMKLIEFAKNRMNKFYNPKLYKPPPKRELTEEERITLNMGGTLAPTNPPGGIAGTGISFAQIRTHERVQKDAPPPPPPGASAHKKSDSSGVLAMMDMLVADIDKEMLAAKMEEKDAQDDYEKLMFDCSEQRATSSKDLTDKKTAKADAEANLQALEDTKTATGEELKAVLDYITSLHGECDFLLEYYSQRKEARASEIDAMGKAKDVLKGP